MTSRIAAVRRGRLSSAHRIVLYGPDGVGKSTLAADAEEPITMDIEGGTGLIDVARYPFRDEPGGHVPRTFDEVLSGIDDLLKNPSPFRTLILDTADRLESLIWAHVVARDSGKMSAKNPKARKLESIEDYGYGKGLQVALDVWRSFCRTLDQLVATRSMNVILVCHAQVKTFKNPEGEDYDRYGLRLNDSPQASAASFIREWADVVGFFRFEELVSDLEGVRAKGVSTGSRIIHFKRHAAYDAKSRLPLPERVIVPEEHPWSLFAQAIRQACDTGPDALRGLIAAEVARIGNPGITARVETAVGNAADNTTTLSQILNKLREIETAKEAA